MENYGQKILAPKIEEKRQVDVKVSVIVVNYNSGELLSECATSALPQSDEFIIVDNASHDTSIENCVRDYGNQPNFQIIQNSENLGFAAACNIGLKAANGEAVLFLNPDCRLSPNAVNEMFKALFSNSECGMTSSLLLNPDGTEQGGGRRLIPTPWRAFVRAFGLQHLANLCPQVFYDFYLHKQPLPETTVEIEATSGACMMVKAEAIADVGLWDEDYFLHCEDLDWCMRFRDKGWKILFVPTSKVYHQVGACGRNRPLFVEWHKHKGMIRFYHKFFRYQHPWWLMQLVHLGVWLRFGFVCIYYAYKLKKVRSKALSWLTVKIKRLVRQTM